MVAYTNTFGTAGNDTLKAGIRPEMLFGGPGDDTLTSARTYDSLLLGGTGNDVYIAGSSAQSTFVIETGGDPNDRAVDIYSSWPASVMGTIDGRHLVITNFLGSNTVILVDWQKPQNVIESWTFKGKTMSYAEFSQSVYSSSNFYGDMALDRFPAAYQTIFKNLLAEAEERAAWYEGAAKVAVTTPTIPTTPVTPTTPVVVTTPASPDHTVTGTAANDILTGSDKNDLLVGLGGSDTLSGGYGDDVLSGNEGDDQLTGGYGNDVLYGNQESDRLIGGYGSDTLFGGQGTDTVSGDYGDDLLYGQRADDVLYGEAGNDTLFGGQGSDRLDGGGHHDVLFGNMGNDTLVGDSGNDTFTGGAGADRFGVGDLGWDVITDFNAAEGDHLLNFKSSAPAIGNDGAGNTLLTFDYSTKVVLLGVAPESFSTAWLVSA
ncbi:MAG TPA: calcium-binding protein [Azospirillum sp.]|nr:calcium-binding protein [Azospirillum sp.]